MVVLSPKRFEAFLWSNWLYQPEQKKQHPAGRLSLIIERKRSGQKEWLGKKMASIFSPNPFFAPELLKSETLHGLFARRDL